MIMNRLVTFLTLLLLTLVCETSKAGESCPVERKDSSVVEQFSIWYKCDSIDVNPDYLSNRSQISRIKYYIQNSPRIDSITIHSWSSPEGRYVYNKHLSHERAKAAKRLLLSHSTDSLKLNASKIKINPTAENWEGLIKRVKENYTRPDREAVLAILHDPRINDDVRKWKLKCLDNGRSWRYMIDNYMPELRAASWVCVWGEVMEPLRTYPAITSRATTYERGLVPPPSEKSGRTIFALKSNLLYDAVTALNFSLEIPFNEKFSILYEHHCPWWLSKSNKYCLQFLSFGGEFRWWFAPRTQTETAKRKQRDALVGHFLGVYGWTGKSDIQIDNRLGCYQFEFCSAGLTYGYSMPISKYLNMEFSISAGYAQIPYQHYIPTEDWSILIRDDNKAGTLHYFGPTKAEISLVIPIRTKFKGGRK